MQKEARLYVIFFQVTMITIKSAITTETRVAIVTAGQISTSRHVAYVLVNLQLELPKSNHKGSVRSIECNSHSKCVSRYEIHRLETSGGDTVVFEAVLSCERGLICS